MANTIEFADVVKSTQVDVEITDSVKRENIEIEDVNGLTKSGDGSKYLANDGTYKTVQGSGTGDMNKSVYDTNDNGIVDDSERVGGYLPNELPVSDAVQLELDNKADISYVDYENDQQNTVINQNTSDISDHINDLNNPHSTTYSQVGAEQANPNIQEHIADTITNPHNITPDMIGSSPEVHTHEISDVNGLQTELDGKMNDGEAFLKTEHIDVSNGNAGVPIITTTGGMIDASLVPMSGGYSYQGEFTPTDTAEYPDTTGVEYGGFWDIVGLDDINGYTFTGGDLAGQTIYNGMLLIWSESGWTMRETEINPDLYYKLDGTQPITAPLAGGNQQAKNFAPATENGDLVEYSQISGLATMFLPLDGTLAMTGNLDFGTFRGINAGDGVDAADLVNKGQLDSHINDTSNPHNVDASDVGALPLSGGSLSGNLDISTQTPEVKLTDTDDTKRTKFVGYPSDLRIETEKSNVIFSGYDGGDLSGDVFVRKNGISYSFYTSYNDGSGSGLDADLLDGLDSNEFSLSTHTHVASDITDFDEAVSNNSNVSTNTAQRHTHSNLGIIDNITDSGSGIIISDDERNNLHSHANKTILDSITDGGSGDDFLADDGLYKTAVKSDNSEASGVDKILNMVSLTQAEYDSITPVANTLYIVVGSGYYSVSGITGTEGSYKLVSTVDGMKVQYGDNYGEKLKLDSITGKFDNGLSTVKYDNGDVYGIKVEGDNLVSYGRSSIGEEYEVHGIVSYDANINMYNGSTYLMVDGKRTNIVEITNNRFRYKFDDNEEFIGELRIIKD